MQIIHHLYQQTVSSVSTVARIHKFLLSVRMYTIHKNKHCKIDHLSVMAVEHIYYRVVLCMVL